MKIAAFADVHANFEGLQTISEHIEKWKPDVTLVAGDIINRGPRPRECLDFTLRKIQTDSWQVIRGNHERFVISVGHEWRNYTQYELAYNRPIFWTYQQLDGDLAFLESYRSNYKYYRQMVRKSVWYMPLWSMIEQGFSLKQPTKN